VYFNVEFVRERLFALLDARSDAIRLVVFDLGAVPNIDLAGGELLRDLPRLLRARQIAFELAGANGEVRAALRRVGFEPEPRRETAGQTVDRVVSAWQATA
jgi:MFS superfamily sulfate permease-like transporter